MKHRNCPYSILFVTDIEGEVACSATEPILTADAESRVLDENHAERRLTDY